MYSVKASISFNASLALQLILNHAGQRRNPLFIVFFSCPRRLLQVFCVIVKSKLMDESMN